jgi:hypothetical protein
MRFRWIPASFALVLAASEPAFACIVHSPIKLEDVRYADLVVVGRIHNYQVVRDEAFRQRMLGDPNLPASLRKIYEGSNSLLSDYARFDIVVDDVLRGSASDRISVTWDNSTFGEPETLPAGPFLVALRMSSSASPPLRGPSATILPTPDSSLHTLLQAPCSSPFLFEIGSDAANDVRRVLLAN